MKILAEYVMHGRLQAAGVAGLCGVLSWLMPPVSYLSGAAVGLVALRHGAREGAFVIAGAALLSGAVAFGGFQNLLPVASLLVALWLPVWLAALVLRVSREQGVMLSAVGVMAGLFVIAMRVTLSDVDAWWEEILKRVLRQAEPDRDVLVPEEMLVELAAVMNPLIAAALELSVVVTLLLARWWQAALYNPGGFRAEFELLRLPGPLAVPTVIMILYVVYEFVTEARPYGVIVDLVVVACVLYCFQGLAVVHHQHRARKHSKVWLVILYVVLFFTPHYTVFGLAACGLLDRAVNFRGLPPPSFRGGAAA
ncbi:MAG: DUF2232 domain-containing protein [Gammaproteobacteria bacterium]